ncbi:uncharacterized protein H6S33_013039 [Morchella sextelata]|uniref:uncharacterized protein n=1 Tax=Morchella sextelata TaxID=1174677 RepID=UPI001D045923|nr:uncharacterized protein H6S33_013039 [Morchella sextelata]KAH0609553.1 hypothetical protein H6S33_013039 [Morchella sextelata]
MPPIALIPPLAGDPPRAHSLEIIQTFIQLFRLPSLTPYLPPPSSRVHKLPGTLTAALTAAHPSFPALGALLLHHPDFALARAQHAQTLAHHVAVAAFDAEQLPAVCALLQVFHAPHAYIDAQRVPTLDDIPAMMRARKALDAVVPIYIARARLVMDPAWGVVHPRAAVEPVFELGETEAAVKVIERAFLRVWTMGRVVAGREVDMHRVRNRRAPQRYDQENQDVFWAFMQRVPVAEVGVLRGCVARVTAEEAGVGYVLGLGNRGEERRVARCVRDLLFWSYDFGAGVDLD